MRALVKTKEGPGNVSLTDLPKPVPRHGEVRIKVMAAGVCGTDIKIWKGDAWSNPPVVLGHEYSGIIDSVGEGVSGFRAGDRVVSETAQVYCGSCEYCKSGRYLMCQDRLSIGYGVDGAFAEYIVVRSDILHRIPDSLSYDEAALCEPLAVAIHGSWDWCDVQPTHTVLVMGPGTIGQLAARVLKARGATVILMGTEADRGRLEIAKEAGIDLVTTGGPEFDEKYGQKIDIAVDCSGAAPAVNAALRLLKKNGKLVQIGLSKPVSEIAYALLPQKELSIFGSFGHRYANWEQAIALLATGRVKVGKIITDKFPLRDWETAFGKMERQDGIKMLLDPSA